MLTKNAWIAVGLAGLCAACSSLPVTITPPKVAEGGRALSIAVRPDNQQRMIVATETGGLFTTFDGGKNWQHQSGMPNFRTIDVAYASLSPNVIIATARSQYRAINDGGIWRSVAGGGSWTQPPGWAPPPGPDCTSRPSAYGISNMPLSHTFYVGTDCGLAVSRDDGATWANIIIDPNSSGPSGFKNRISSVLVLNRTSGVAVGDGGTYFLGTNGAWSKSSSDPSGGKPPLHGLAAPFWAADNIFLHASAGQKLWLSTDSGASWTQVDAPREENRESFVRAARSLSQDDGKFDVYFGDGTELHGRTFTIASSNSGSWHNLSSDHADPSDIAFDLDRRVPILLASDGGVHRTTNQGSSWTLTGGGFGGFDALQITEVTGQMVTGSSPHQDLYYATQDNGLRASKDGGQSWPGKACGEGRFLRTGATSDNHQGVIVTGSGIGCAEFDDPVVNFVSGPHLEHVKHWPNAPDGSSASPAQAPFHMVEEVYGQNITDVSTMPPRFDFFLTLTAGSHWTKTFSSQFTPKGKTVFAGFLANPTVFQGVERPGGLSGGGTHFGLIRARDLAGQPVAEPADGGGMGALGSLRTPVARYVVFGVDPNNANHLIAPDVENNEMKLSSDGGTTWFSFPILTNAVTGNGAYLFRILDFSLASVISWDPYNSCHILIGTMQNGVIQSRDGGNTWKQIEGSKAIPYVTSFYFPPTGRIWVSSNGRGLWNLNIERRTPGDGRCHFPEPPPFEPPGDVVLNATTGSGQPFRGLDDPSICPRCSVVVVRNGWLTDLQESGGSIQEIAISGGTIFQLDRSGREIPLTIPNAYRPGEGKFEGRVSGSALTAGQRVRGLVLEGTRIRFLIAAGRELSFVPARVPMVYALAAGNAGDLSTVQSGEAVQVIGTNFLPSKRPELRVRILFDGGVVAQEVEVRPDGSFSVEIPVEHSRGEVMVTAEQRDGRRLTIENTIFDVVHNDRL